MRNHSIDTLKCICAILVVFLHTPSVYGDAIKPLTRCAVPCFFMISGYFMYQHENMGLKIQKGLRKMAWIFVWSTMLFATVREIASVFLNDEFYTLSSSDVMNFFLFNVNPFAGHLWYISAYFYVLIIAYFIDKIKAWKQVCYLIPFLLMADLAFGKYSLLIWNREFPYYLLRNFLFVGIPYFSLGVLIKERNLFVNNKYKLTLMGGGNYILLIKYSRALPLELLQRKPGA